VKGAENSFGDGSLMAFRAAVIRCSIIVLLAGLVSTCAAYMTELGGNECHIGTYFSRPQFSPADRALYLAKRAVAANDTWADQANYLKPEQNSDGSWTVLVSRQPKTPDGYRLITVGSDGRIQRYFRVP